MTVSKPDIPVTILAGGESRRLQHNRQLKWQLPFGNKRLLEVVAARISAQTSTVVINASPGQPMPDCHGLTVITDQHHIGTGPLAGLLTALSWAKELQQPWVATIPCDSPFFPDDLLQRLHQQALRTQAQAVIATSNQRHHPVFGLWSTQLHGSLANHLDTTGDRSISRWSATLADHIDFPATRIGQQSVDPFFNINTENDYQQALAIQQVINRAPLTSSSQQQ